MTAHQLAASGSVHGPLAVVIILVIFALLIIGLVTVVKAIGRKAK